MSKIYDLHDRWDNVSVQWNAIKVDVSDEGSAAGSKLLDLQKDSESRFSVDPDGNVSAHSGMVMHSGNIVIADTGFGIRYPDGTFQNTAAMGGGGETGPTGPAGNIGPTGAQGTQGATGPQGIQGVTGPQGTQGDIGATGPQGIQGVTGPQGIQGDIGATGPQGIQGVTGPQGTQGNIGATGPQGIQGLIGDTGSTGPTGAQGIQGPTGAASVITGPTGSAGTQGIQGPTGAASFITGPTGPAGTGGGGGGTSITWLNKSANYTIAANEGVFANTSEGSWTLTLPASAALGDTVYVVDPAGSWLNYNLTIARNGLTIMGIAEDLICDTNYASLALVYDGTSWRLV